MNGTPGNEAPVVKGQDADRLGEKGSDGMRGVRDTQVLRLRRVLTLAPSLRMTAKTSKRRFPSGMTTDDQPTLRYA